MVSREQQGEGEGKRANCVSQDEFVRFSETLSSWVAHLGTCYTPTAPADEGAEEEDDEDESED